MTRASKITEWAAGISAGAFIAALVASVPIMAATYIAPPWWQFVFVGNAFLMIGAGVMLFVTAIIHAFLSQENPNV